MRGAASARPTRLQGRLAPARPDVAREPAAQQTARGRTDRLHREPHVLQHRQRREDVGALERARRRRAASCARPARRPRRGPSSSMRPAVGLDLARQHVDERGLAGAVRADHGVQLALVQRDGDVAHGHQPAEVAGQPVGGQHRRCGRRASAIGRGLGVGCAWRDRQARPADASAAGRCRSGPSAASTITDEQHDQPLDQQLALGDRAAQTSPERRIGQRADDGAVQRGRGRPAGSSAVPRPSGASRSARGSRSRGAWPTCDPPRPPACRRWTKAASL